MQLFEDSWAVFLDHIKNFLGSADVIILTLLKIILIVLSARLLIRILNKIIHSWMENKAKKHPGSTYEKKQHTLSSLFRSITKYAIYFFMVVALLEVLGLGKVIGSIVATAGIGGIALGLGAQSLIGDIVGGFFNLFEDSFAVGDYIRLPAADLEGVVESFSLRTTRIKLMNGQTAIITNGSLGTIINYTRNGYTLILNYEIAVDEDDARVEKLMLSTVREYMQAKNYVPETVHYGGIVSFTPLKKTLRITAEVPPLQQWQAERDINKVIMDLFRAEGIRLPEYQEKVAVKRI